MRNDEKNDAFSKWKLGPRITSLSAVFENLASGKEGVPIKEVLPLPELLTNKYGLDKFYEKYAKYQGPFANHFNASIPFVLEEDCRIGNGILKFLTDLSDNECRITKLQTIGTAEAVQAKTIVSLSENKVISLSNSPTKSNKQYFDLNKPEGCFFYLGPFFDIDKSFLYDHQALRMFADGFDIIIEDTTFQMYDTNRIDQIGFIKQNLSEDGLFLCLEKCLQANEVEYLRRETQKDNEFKSKYFSITQIFEKRQVLNEMVKGQVLLSDLINALSRHFDNIELLWNSCNFYLLVASNSSASINRFKQHLPSPIIPPGFVYENPRKIK